MTPYYDEDGITIYHADCADVLPTIDPESVDLLLTDPPYGNGYHIERTKARIGDSSTGRLVSMGGKPRIVGNDLPIDLTRLLRFSRLVLFGANYYANQLPTSPGWIVWDKSDGGRGPDNTFSDVELAWSNVASQPQIYRLLWKGIARDSEIIGRNGGMNRRVLHPTQKPVALMRWIVNRWTEPGDLVLDPFMGSGPVAQACADLGRRYIGIEIVEEYCNIAVKRLAQGVLPLEEVISD